METVHPEDRETIAASFREATPFDIEFRITRPDGAERIIRSLGQFVTDKTGKPIRVLGTSHDITERNRAQRELASTAAIRPMPA
jgi:PAS domain S-box-containing protein